MQLYLVLTLYLKLIIIHINIIDGRDKLFDNDHIDKSKHELRIIYLNNTVCQENTNGQASIILLLSI